MIFASLDGLLAVGQRRCILLDGCFDPLHFGHVKYLRDAKRAFPEWSIVVAVAPDSEIRQKGREPVFGQMARCAIVDGLAGVDVVLAQDRPTHEIISALKPHAYVKGTDWQDKLPAEILTACALQGTQVVYLGARLDSSTTRLRDWVAHENRRALAELETLVQSQTPAEKPWQPVTDYSFKARKEIEGKHPELIQEVFQPRRIWDVGCGPGFLITALKELGIEATGFDVNPPKGGRWWRHARQADIARDLRSDDEGLHFGGLNVYIQQPDLVICREVLEHLTIMQVRRAVPNLCKLSSKFVYVTTRFAKAPSHLLSVDTSDDLDPTHCTMLTQEFLRTLFVLEGAKRRADLEARMDWQNKGRVLVYEV